MAHACRALLVLAVLAVPHVDAHAQSYSLPLGIGAAGSATTAVSLQKDSDGNLYLAGQYTNPISLCGQNLPIGTPGSASSFVAKFDQTGSCQWVQRATGNVAIAKIAVDADKNIYVAGTVTGSASFGANFISVYLSQLFVAKITPAGQWAWVAYANGTPTRASESRGASISIAPNGGIWILANFRKPYANPPIDAGLELFGSNGTKQDTFSYQGEIGAAGSLIWRLTPSGAWTFRIAMFGAGHTATDIATTDNASGGTSIYMSGGAGPGMFDPQYTDVEYGGATSLLPQRGVNYECGSQTGKDGFVWKLVYNLAADGKETLDGGDHWLWEAENTGGRCEVQPLSVQAQGNDVYVGGRYYVWDIEPPSLNKADTSKFKLVKPTQISGWADTAGFVVQLSGINGAPVQVAAVVPQPQWKDFWADITKIALDGNPSSPGLYAAGKYNGWGWGPPRFYDFDQATSNLRPKGGSDSDWWDFVTGGNQVWVGKLNLSDFSWTRGTATLAWESVDREVGGLVALPDGRSYVAGSFVNEIKFRAGTIFPDATLTGLGNEANVFLEGLTPAIRWATPEPWTIGAAITRPSGTVASQPDIQMLGGGDSQSYFFWSPVSNELFPIRPGMAIVKWKTSTNPTDQSRFPVFGTGVWPTWPLSHVSTVPVELEPSTLVGYKFVKVAYTESGASVDANKIFNCASTGKSVLMYTQGSSGNFGTEPVRFQVVNTDPWTALRLPDLSWDIGTEITDGVHSDPTGKNGYVLNSNARYDGYGADKAYDRSTRTGRIFPVNKDSASSAADDMVVAWYAAVGSIPGVAWPTRSRLYNCQWPASPLRIVIANGLGSAYGGQPTLDFDATPAPRIYVQNDRDQPGYNPNEEHALVVSNVVYALRSDLNNVGTTTSDPYVLVKYWNTATNKWAYYVYEVDAEGFGYAFSAYTKQVEQTLPPPNPLNQLPQCPQTSGTGTPTKALFVDYQGTAWAAAQGTVDVRYYYPLQPGFLLDLDGNGTQDQPPGTCLPWLDRYAGTIGTPINTRFSLNWPAAAPQLFIGETLMTPKRGLPAITTQAAVKIVYDDQDPSDTDPNKQLANLYDPLSRLQVALALLPSDIKVEPRTGGGLTIVGTSNGITKLPISLKRRFLYDPLLNKLGFEGVLDGSGTGDPLILPNVMTDSEKATLRALSTSGPYQAAVDALYALTLSSSAAGSLVGSMSKALTTGTATGTGYLTLAFNDDAGAGGPVSLNVVKVDCGVYRGQIQVMPSNDVFDEALTLRHSGDFAGRVSGLTFSWYYYFPPDSGPDPIVPDDGSTPPGAGWLFFGSGAGLNEITIKGPGVLTLSDSKFLVSYTGFSMCSNQTVPSPWAGAPGSIPPKAIPQLAEGWVKRVSNALNPFDARVKDFHKAPTQTYVSMVQQAGQRYEGDIAFSGDPGNINQVGLIETYTTVMRRAKLLSVDQGIMHGGANDAILNVASRIAGFYALLGNEAVSDAADPMIGFGTTSGEYGTTASSIFAFMNQLPSLLEEELALLRGRDDTSAATTASPVYNKLFWNFTNGEGEVAYQQVYNILDQNQDGTINETDARILVPQGHGDAWGHLLTASTTYYDLLRHPYYSWQARSEQVLVAGSPVAVDYLDERRFAQIAATKANVGSQLMDLTYRQSYVEDPAGQWQGYRDTDQDRAWGVDGWARRTAQGAYMDWVVANALLPPDDPADTRTGIQKVDRSTVAELRSVATQLGEVQTRMDKADQGLNPLGLAKNVVPFDIDPAYLEIGSGSQGKTHFEQIYDRALGTLDNVLEMFNHANQFSQMLRQNQDSLDDFSNNVRDQERDYNNRLIEIFGTPYTDDIGPGKTYPGGYTGSDLYRYMVIDPSDLTGASLGSTVTTTAYFKPMADGRFFPGDTAATDPLTTDPGVTQRVMTLTYSFSLDGLGMVKPASWTGKRAAPGELQALLADIYQARASFEQSLQEYNALLGDIDSQAGDIRATFGFQTGQIKILNRQKDSITSLNEEIASNALTAAGLRQGAQVARDVGDVFKESLPGSVGFSFDAFSIPRSIGLSIAYGVANGLEFGGVAADSAQLKDEQRKEIVGLQSSIDVEIESDNLELGIMKGALQGLIRQEPARRLAVAAQRAAIQQAIANYSTKLAEGTRLLGELIEFRKRTATQVQDYRYEDMAFRVFRNDSIQKYRAQFDQAARYTYLAATAYDYDTNLLGTAGASGRRFLTDIVRQRGLGQVQVSGTGSIEPIAGSNGLADPLGRMAANFAVLKNQLGFNSPQTETNRFSLRREMLRIREDAQDDALWIQALSAYRVPDLWQLEEFRRYFKPFAPRSAGPQPGIVIPFNTTVTFGLNFFGNELGGGDSAYDSTQFATKARTVGVWFTNYNGSGLSNTPRVYLAPVGADVLRSPSDDEFQTREWKIVDQVIPIPFPIGASDLSNPDWKPSDSLSETSVAIRRYASLRAYHDAGDFDPAEASTDSRLIGRSVWNTRWLLIIPGGTLLGDADEGLDTLIYGAKLPGSEERDGNGVKDIKIFFQTYAYSGI